MRSQRAFDITYTVHQVNTSFCAVYLKKHTMFSPSLPPLSLSLQKCLCVSSGDHTSGQLYQTFLTCPYSLSPHFFSSLTQVTANKHQPHLSIIFTSYRTYSNLLRTTALLKKREKFCFLSTSWTLTNCHRIWKSNSTAEQEHLRLMQQNIPTILHFIPC